MREDDVPLDKVNTYFNFQLFQHFSTLVISISLSKLSCQEKYKVHNITVIRIAEFINTVVGTRKTNNNKAAVVMKLDVEVRIQYLYLTIYPDSI